MFKFTWSINNIHREKETTKGTKQIKEKGKERKRAKLLIETPKEQKYPESQNKSRQPVFGLQFLIDLEEFIASSLPVLPLITREDTVNMRTEETIHEHVAELTVLQPEPPSLEPVTKLLA